MEKIIRIDDRSGLVLEGGGMRGVFTCGVLDSFMDPLAELSQCILDSSNGSIINVI